MSSKTLTLDNKNLTFAIDNSTSLGETRSYVHVNEPMIFINQYSVYKSFDPFGSVTAFIYTCKNDVHNRSLTDKKFAAILSHCLLETTTPVRWYEPTMTGNRNVAKKVAKT